MTVNDRGGSRTATIPSFGSSDPSSSCAVSTSGSVRGSPGRAAVTVLIWAGPAKVKSRSSTSASSSEGLRLTSVTATL